MIQTDRATTYIEQKDKGCFPSVARPIRNGHGNRTVCSLNWIYGASSSGVSVGATRSSKIFTITRTDIS